MNFGLEDVTSIQTTLGSHQVKQMLAVGFSFLEDVQSRVQVSEVPGVHRIWKLHYSLIQTDHK